MNIHAHHGSIEGMDISLLSTTSDIEQLRTLALTMVQKVVSENAEKEQRIRLLEEALMLARQQRFGRKSEVLSGLQRQLFEEDVDTDIAATEARLRKLLQPDDAGETQPASRPVRKPLPAHLPRVVKTIEPASVEDCPDPECPGKLRHILDTRKGGTSRQGYLWSYVSGGHTGNPIIVFECHAGRGAKYPQAFLSEWTGGYLVSDDYDAYKAVAKENGRIINAGCWSHPADGSRSYIRPAESRGQGSF